jgi:hypothetical protein
MQIPCVYIPGPAPAVSVANSPVQKVSCVAGGTWNYLFVDKQQERDGCTGTFDSM